jgi:hypothetical protein
MLPAPLIAGPLARVVWRRRSPGNLLIGVGKRIHRWAGGCWL